MECRKRKRLEEEEEEGEALVKKRHIPGLEGRNKVRKELQTDQE